MLKGDRPLFPRQRFYSSHLDAGDITFQQADYTLRYIYSTTKTSRETTRRKRKRKEREQKEETSRSTA